MWIHWPCVKTVHLQTIPYVSKINQYLLKLLVNFLLSAAHSIFVIVFHFHSGFQESKRLSDTRSGEVWVRGYTSYKVSLLLAKVFLFFKQT